MNQTESRSLFRGSKKTIFLVIVTVAITLAAVFLIGWLSDPRGAVRLPSSGILRTANLKAYWDETHSNETKEVTWGIINPGSLHNVTFYLQSVSNVVTRFEMAIGNWTFRNSHDETVLGPATQTSYMSLTWDYPGTSVSPNETVKVTLTLTADDSADFVLFLINNDVQKFSVDITARAIENP